MKCLIFPRIWWLTISFVVTLTSPKTTDTITYTKSANSHQRHNFAVSNDGLQLDNKKIRINAGEIHYFRVPSCRWQDRLRKLKNSGLNAVSTAIEWAFHEPSSEIYDWGGDANFTRFIELAQELELFAIVRAGPFIGADRDLGGLPGWLLTVKNTSDPSWMHRSSSQYRFYVERWLSRLLPKISNLLVTNGGPILMIQIDSDLGATDHCENTDWLYQIFMSHLGNNAVLFTMENVNEKLKCKRIPQIIPGFRIDPVEFVDVFNGSVSELFSAIESQAGLELPRIIELRTSRAWAWGSKPWTFDSDLIARTFAAILSKEPTILLYMFSGGTNYERAGNNGHDLMGLTTSYFDNALLNEAGEPTKIFFKIRSMLTKYEERTPDDGIILESPQSPAYGDLKFESLGSLLDPQVFSKLRLISTTSKFPLTFAGLGAPFGPVLYQTRIPRDYSKITSIKRGADLRCTSIRDRAYVYLDNRLAGIMNRARHSALAIDPKPGQVLRILVESQGYLTNGMINDEKGITANVYLDSTVLTNWTMYPMDFINNASKLERLAGNLMPRRAQKRGLCMYRANFVADKETEEMPCNSFLNLGKFGKGNVYLNSKSLGKFWLRAGPQQSLHVPSCYIKHHPHVNKFFIVEMQRPFKLQTNDVGNYYSNNKKFTNDTRSISSTGLNNAPVLLTGVICFIHTIMRSISI